MLVTVYRAGREVVLSVTLDEKPQELPASNTAPAPETQLPKDPFEDWSEFFPFFGG